MTAADVAVYAAAVRVDAAATGAGAGAAAEVPVDHGNVIDGYLTRCRTRVQSPFIVLSDAGAAG